MKYLVDEKGHYIHRKVFRNYWRVKLETGWHVHHIDRDTHNNDIRNLIALDSKFHEWLHKDNAKYDELVKEGVLDMPRLLNLQNALFTGDHNCMNYPIEELRNFNFESIEFIDDIIFPSQLIRKYNGYYR